MLVSMFLRIVDEELLRWIVENELFLGVMDRELFETAEVRAAKAPTVSGRVNFILATVWRTSKDEWRQRIQ